MNYIQIKYWAFERFLYVALAGVILVVVVGIISVYSGSRDSEKGTLFLAGGVASLFYFLQRQRLAEMQMLHKLFTAFNERFEEMDEALNDIVKGDPTADFTAPEKKVLSQYFNLCAEEYFFHEQTYIHPTVWETWLAGMRWFRKNSDRLKRRWDADLDGKAYYGMRTKLFVEPEAPHTF